MIEEVRIVDPRLYRSTDEFKQPLVAILLCTFNGAKFLSKQLDSIQAQKHSNFLMYASDDGSVDESRLILKRYQARIGKAAATINSGPQTGFADNFLSLICDSNIKADYYAFSDQDDMWEPDKLSIAIEKLEPVSSDVPAIYCSRTSLIDSLDNEIGLTTKFEKSPSFANALMQNIAGGNTMVLNNAARELVIQAGKNPVVCHDWWAYLLVAGAGGVIIYDSYPTIKYRQHSFNRIGCKNSWWDRLIRCGGMLKGRYRDMNTIHIQSLQAVRHLLTPENTKILDEFSSARDRWLIPRLLGIWKSGVYRQTMIGTIGLVIAAVFKKI